MYAQVVFNLPIQGPFDYSIPTVWEQNLKPGMRVEVSFGKRYCLGYIVGKVEDTRVKNIKPILKIIDTTLIIDKTMLRITQQVADYYACSWGEAIEAAMPVSLRRGRKITLDNQKTKQKILTKKPQFLLIQELKEQKRWEIYLHEIKDSLAEGKGVILLTPDKESAGVIQKEIKKKLNIKVGLLHSHQSAKEELSQWLEIKQERLRIVVGTRRAIFAPLTNLGLIIIEEEQSPVYKQDSVPHYNAVGVARIRAKIEGLKLILSSPTPTLEAWYQAKKGRINYILKKTEIPTNQIKIIDLHRVGFISERRNVKLSSYLEEAINQVLKQNGKVLLFLNRRGFAIFAYCQSCGFVLRCPRCNANLILHFKDNKLTCHQCNYQAESPRICMQCNAGYIRYSGLGTEKLESELSRLYPGVGICRLDKEKRTVSENARIIVSTESIFRHTFNLWGASIKEGEENKSFAGFNLVAVIWPDTVLNRPDFRSAEKLFSLLLHLSCLTSNSLIIQTGFPRHYCFQALAQKRIDFFYETELGFRRQSKLPPFNHIIMVRLRGKNKDKLSKVVEELFNILNNKNKDRAIKIDSHSAQIFPKKRDKFHEQILIKTRSVTKAVNFLKGNLSDFHRGGIIITVDVDPV